MKAEVISKLMKKNTNDEGVLDEAAYAKDLNDELNREKTALVSKEVDKKSQAQLEEFFKEFGVTTKDELKAKITQESEKVNPDVGGNSEVLKKLEELQAENKRMIEDREKENKEKELFLKKEAVKKTLISKGYDEDKVEMIQKVVDFSGNDAETVISENESDLEIFKKKITIGSGDDDESKIPSGDSDFVKAFKEGLENY